MGTEHTTPAMLVTGSAERGKFTGRIEEEYYHRKNDQAIVAPEHGYCRGCGDTRTIQKRTANGNTQITASSFDDIAEQSDSSMVELLDFVSTTGQGYLGTVKHLLCNKTFQVVRTTMTGQQRRQDASGYTEVLRAMGILHCHHCEGKFYRHPLLRARKTSELLWYREDKKAAFDDDKPLVAVGVAALARLQFARHNTTSARQNGREPRWSTRRKMQSTMPTRLPKEARACSPHVESLAASNFGQQVSRIRA